jgi:hypothetical protein
MPFGAGLRTSLDLRHEQLPSELDRGDSLEDVLNRHLLAVEENFDDELIASILLLSPDGKRLHHGAAPRLPQIFCEAIDGLEIGPSAGSCGTAAFRGLPVYVADIANDPLWHAYRDLAIPHGLRSCWSTPIFDADGVLLGTFAIYSREPGTPRIDEVDAIAMITDSVARAIPCAQRLRGSSA